MSYSVSSLASRIPLNISSSVWESIHTLFCFLSFTPAIWATRRYIYSPSRPESVHT